MMSESDARFLSALEACQIPNADFRHRDHLRAAWLYVTCAGSSRAVKLMERTIRRFAAYHGHVDKFHATLTAAWVKLVAAHVEFHACPTFDAFIDHNSKLLDKDLPLQFYSRTALFSDRARVRWVDPDLQNLPTT